MQVITTAALNLPTSEARHVDEGSSVYLCWNANRRYNEWKSCYPFGSTKIYKIYKTIQKKYKVNRSLKLLDCLALLELLQHKY